MSQELIYTSAPKGLKLGARGLCTVASTPGMAKNLADRLESLSGYRHLFPPGSPEAHLNPANFSYLRFVLGGQTYCLLSRIADAGLDYTQRTNKLAHHITLQHDELPSAGPAWLASQPQVFETIWNRDPELLPNSRRQIPQGQLTADVCGAWKTVTGDAGWAGVLVERLLSHASGDAYLIYKPGTDILELFTEAQALLSPEQRWEATFSTYFTNLPPGVECRWRGVVDGSPEALRARRSPGLLVVDLLAALGPAPESEFVDRARSGNVPSITKTQTIESSVIDRKNQSQPHRLAHATSGSLADTAANSTEAFLAKAPPKLPSHHRRYTAAHIRDAQRGRRWLLIAAYLLMAMLGGAGVCTLLLYASGVLQIAKPTNALPSDDLLIAKHIQTNGSTENAQEAKTHDRNSPDSSTIKNGPHVSTTPTELKGGAEDHSSGGTSEHGKSDTKDASSAVATTIKNEIPAKSDPAKSVSPPTDKQPVHPSAGSAPANSGEPTPSGNQARLLPDNIFDHVNSDVDLKGVPDQRVQIIGDNWMNPVDLATFPVLDPDIDLSLEPSNSGTDGTLTVLKEQTVHHWLIYVRDAPLADLSFEKTPPRLTFRWQKTAQVASKQQVDSVRFAVLLLAAKTESGKTQKRQVSFYTAERVSKPLRLDVKTGRQRQIVNRDLPTGQPLVLRFQLTGLGQLIEKSQQVGAVMEKPGETSVRFGPDRSIELRLQLQRDNENHPLVKIVLMAVNNNEKPTELVSTVQKELNRRAAFAVDAIINHVKSTPRLNATWQTLGVPIRTLQQQNGEVIFVFNEADERNYSQSLKKKNIYELQMQEIAFRKEARVASSLKLDKHIASFPHLEKWSEIAQQVCSKAEIHVRLTRQVSRPLNAANGIVEADVFLAGDPTSMN